MSSPTGAGRRRRSRVGERPTAMALATVPWAATVGAGAAEVVRSWCCRSPSDGGGADPEHGEASEVLGGGEKVEVGVDLASAAHTSSSSAVLAAHHVAEFAFDLGAGRPVVVDPVGVLLLSARISERLLVAADPDGAPAFGVGALGSQRARGASVAEVGDAVAVGVAADRHGHLVGAGDRVGVEVDGEAVLGEQPSRRGGRLGLATRVDALFGEMVQELAGAVGGIAVDGRLIAASIAAGLGGPATAELRLASSFAGLGPARAGRRLVVLAGSPATALTASTATLGCRAGPAVPGVDSRRPRRHRLRRRRLRCRR